MSVQAPTKDFSPAAAGLFCSAVSESLSVGSSPLMALGESSPEAGGGDCLGVRLRAGGIVLRRGPQPAHPEVLLVSRRRNPGSFTVPAGKFEDDVDKGSFEACALRETQEEAGMECSILFDLGWYKGLGKDNIETRTRFFAMNFVSELRDWSEESERVRCWKSLEEAQSLTEYSPMLGQVFRQLVKDLGERKETCEPLRSEPSMQRNRQGGSGDSICSAKRELRPAVSTTSISSDDSDSLAQLLSALPETEEPSAPPAAAATVPHEEQAAVEVVSHSGDREPEARATSSRLSRKVSMSDANKLHIEDIDGERFRFYGNQVGGHFCLVKPAPESQRILVTPNPPSHGTAAGEGKEKLKQLELPANQVVLKPLEQREHRFYTRMIREVPDFAPHMAQLFGTKTLTHRQVSAMTAEVDEIVKKTENFLETRMRSHQFQTYIVLEDLAWSMQRPRILDLKMGFKQRSKHHSQRKRERCRMKAANSTSHSLGFRICGLSTEQKGYDKYWGRNLPLLQMRDALAEYFLHHEASEEQRRHVVSEFMGHVSRLRELISRMPGWRFWNTSLLFLFDGGDLSALPVMRLIDFAHCTLVKGGSADCEFLAGLRNIEAFLEAVRDGHPFEGWIRERLADPPAEGVQDAEEAEPASDDDKEDSRCAETTLEDSIKTPAQDPCCA